MKYAAKIMRRNTSQTRKEAADGVLAKNMHQRSGFGHAGDYTAKNITILSHEKSLEKFEWLKAGELAAKYNRTLAFVERGIEAYRLAGSNAEAFEDRYLKKLPSAPRNRDAEVISRELQMKSRR